MIAAAIKCRRIANRSDASTAPTRGVRSAAQTTASVSGWVAGVSASTAVVQAVKTGARAVTAGLPLSAQRTVVFYSVTVIVQPVALFDGWKDFTLARPVAATVGQACLQTRHANPNVSRSFRTGVAADLVPWEASPTVTVRVADHIAVSTADRSWRQDGGRGGAPYARRGGAITGICIAGKIRVIGNRGNATQAVTDVLAAITGGLLSGRLTEGPISKAADTAIAAAGAALGVGAGAVPR